MGKASGQTQLGLPLAEPPATWGGKRRGAGRPRTSHAMPHRRRPWHDRHHPVHVTYRAARDLPSLRDAAVAGAIVHSISRAHRRTFRVCHFTIQPNHVHLIVEAGSKTSLANGLRALAVRISWNVNRSLGRRGAVFAERSHRRAVATPTETRRLLGYVLLNRAHHKPADGFRDDERIDGVDVCSSGAWFAGWAHRVRRPAQSPPTADAVTWLLRAGWRRRLGPLRLDEHGPPAGDEERQR